MPRLVFRLLFLLSQTRRRLAGLQKLLTDLLKMLLAFLALRLAFVVNRLRDGWLQFAENPAVRALDFRPDGLAAFDLSDDADFYGVTVTMVVNLISISTATPPSTSAGPYESFVRKPENPSVAAFVSA